MVPRRSTVPNAVTGVVNFILRDDFEGFQVGVQQGLPERGEAQTTVVDATWGMNFDDDRGIAAVSLSLKPTKGYCTANVTGLRTMVSSLSDHGLIRPPTPTAATGCG